MAAYTDLHPLKDNTVLRDRIEVACWIAAEAVWQEDPGTDLRRAWAKKVFEDPRQEAYRMLPALLAQNASATVNQITGATDAAILSAVQNVIDLFAT